MDIWDIIRLIVAVAAVLIAYHYGRNRGAEQARQIALEDAARVAHSLVPEHPEVEWEIRQQQKIRASRAEWRSGTYDA